MNYNFDNSTPTPPASSGAKYDFDNPQEPTKAAPAPFASTKTGMAVNTVLGIPKALWDISVWLSDTLTELPGQTLNTAVRFFGGDVPNALVPNKNREMEFETPKVLQVIPGVPKSTNTLAKDTAENEQVLRGYGLDKSALPLAFAGTIGGAALDFTPFGGEKAVIKKLVKEQTAEGVMKILKSMKIEGETAQKFAPIFATAKTTKEVEQTMRMLKSAKGTEQLVELAAKGEGVKGESTKVVNSKIDAAIGDNIEQLRASLDEAVPRGNKLDLTSMETLDNISKNVGKGLTQEERQAFYEIAAKNGRQDIVDMVTKEVDPSLLARQSENTAQTLSRSRQPMADIVPKVNPALPKTVAQTMEEGQSAAQIMIKALKEAGPVRAEQEAIYTATRGQRMAKLQGVAQKTSGEAGFKAEISQLKGEMGKADYSPLREAVSQKNIDTIFDTVKHSPLLSEWDKVTARSGLLKMFDGSVPTEGEIVLLNRVFGSEFGKTLLAKRTLFQKLGDAAIQVGNLPRSFMSSFDLSAPLRQGIFLIDKPGRWFNAFATMFKTVGSEEAFKALQESIFRHPLYDLMQESKLAIMDMDVALTGREEQFMSRWAEKIPVMGKVVRASGRAYSGFLNKLRADVFADLVNKSAALGQDPRKNIKLAKEIATFVNTASGRGNLGVFERSATGLNMIFFSPRLMASRIQILNPHYYLKEQSSFIRKEKLKSLFTVTAMVSTVLGLAKLGGADVGVDPRNADFGKIKIGNTRIDIAGGFLQYIRIAAQVITGQLVSSTSGKVVTLGEGYKPLTRLDIIMNALRNKEAPVMSFITDMLSGKNAAGDPVSVPQELRDRLTPMIVGDIVDLAKDNPDLIPLSILGIFGAGVQTYSGKKSTAKPKYKF